MPVSGHVDDVNPQDYAPPTVNGGGRGGASTQPAVDPTASRTPPPGILHAAKRALISTLANASQFESNLASIPVKYHYLFGDASKDDSYIGAFAKMASDNAAKHRQELADDTAAGGASQTDNEKLAEKVLSAAGSSIPYLAAPEGAVGAGVTGVIQNLDKGAVQAAKEGLKAATFAKAAGLLGKEVEGTINKTPGLRSAPPVVKRAATGATTAAALSPKGEGLSQAIVGGIAGASQKEPLSKNEVRANKLMAATGKTNGDAWTSYKVAGPAMEETATIAGKQPDPSIAGLKKNVQDTLTRLDNEYDTYLTPIRSQQVWGTPIADAIRSRMGEHEINGVTEESKEIGDRLEQRAKEFEKQFTLGSLDGLRKQYFNNRTGNSKEALKERTSADVRADRIAEDAIKDLLYPLVDTQAQAMGKPAGYVRGTLKAQQANLIQLKDALIKRQQALNEKEGIRQGTPITQRSNITLAAHPSGGVVGSLHGLMNRIFGDPDSYKEANKRVGEAFPVKQSTPKDRIAATVAASQSQSKAAPKTVKMQAPNGQLSDIPVDQVDHFKSRGAVVVQ